MNPDPTAPTLPDATETPGEIQLRLAVDRTELARRRTLLAEERTYSAWVRTGLAAVAAGLGLAELMEQIRPGWLASALGVLFITTGATMFGLGFLGYRTALRRSHGPGGDGLPAWVLGVMSLALLVGSAIGLALVLLS